MTPLSSPSAERRVRSLELDAAATATRPRAIDALYDDELDLLTVRGAVDPAALRSVVDRLDTLAPEARWSRPNASMPVEDIHLLGSEAPATPTYRAPRGVVLDEYLASARRHDGEVQRLFGAGFDVLACLEQLLGAFSGGRPARVAHASDGQPFVPCTLRRLGEGRQIGIHHDYHYGLALYEDFGKTLDTRTLISFVVTLQRAQAGGDLRVYGVTPTTPGAPRMPNGFQWDLAAIEQRYDRVTVDYEVGDLFLLASGRCLHSVGRVAGPLPRITLGGFLALDKAGEQVLYWS